MPPFIASSQKPSASVPDNFEKDVTFRTVLSGEKAGWKVRRPFVGLFADLEIRMIDGPIFVNEPYRLEREIIALSESRPVESYWIKTKIITARTGRFVADSILNYALLKDSLPGYAEERNRSN